MTQFEKLDNVLAHQLSFKKEILKDKEGLADDFDHLFSLGDKARWDRELLSFNYSNFFRSKAYFHVIDMATLGCQSARYYTLKRLVELKKHLIEYDIPARRFRVIVGLIENGVG